jgi:hypothetical protein
MILPENGLDENEFNIQLKAITKPSDLTVPALSHVKSEMKIAVTKSLTPNQSPGRQVKEPLIPTLAEATAA